MTGVKIEDKIVERRLAEPWRLLQYKVACMDTCVMLVSITVNEDHNFQPSRKEQKNTRLTSDYQ